MPKGTAFFIGLASGVTELNVDILRAMVDSARLSTAELERITQTVMGAALSSISNHSTPAEQAQDLIAYAAQYGLTYKLAAALLYTGADRPGLLNLLFGNETSMNQNDDQRHTSSSALDIVRLENRVERLSDKLDALAQKVDLLFQRTPLNWNIVIWGIALAILAGAIVWAITVVN